jgi:O-antigen/teichoic acid export membrane protein
VSVDPSDSSLQTTQRRFQARRQMSAVRDRLLAVWSGHLFARNAVTSFALHMVSAGLGLVTALVLARLTGAEGYGIYAVAMVYANIFAYIACCGFPNVIIRSEASGAPEQSEEKRRSIIATATLIMVGAGVALAATGVAFKAWLLPTHTSEAGWAFVLAMVMVVPIAFQRLREAILLGRNQPVLSLLPERLIRPFATLLALAVVWAFLKDQFGATAAISAQFMAYAISIACVVAFVFQTTPRTKRPPLRDIWRAIDVSHLRQALPFLLVGLTTLFATRLDIMMLAMLSDLPEVGTYRLASQVAGIVMVVSTVTQALLSPRVSKLASTNRLPELVAKLPRLGLMLGVAAIALSITVAVAFQVILIWLGPEFQPAAAPLTILLAAFSAVAFLCPAVPLLLMNGAAHRLATANLASLAINALLNLLLIPTYGGTGAAIATLVSLVVLYSLCVFFAWPKTKQSLNP